MKNQIIVKLEPELRHILAHFYYAIECLINNQKYGALDNIKSIEGLIMFEGDPSDWEKYYQRRLGKWQKARKVVHRAGKSVRKGVRKEDR